MIKPETLAKNLENALNSFAINSGRTFKIFCQSGEAPSPHVKPWTDPSGDSGIIYGAMYVQPSQLVPIRGLTVLTISATVEVRVELRRSPKNEDGTYPELDTVCDILSGFVQSKNAETENITEEGKTYCVSVSYSPIVTGDLDYDAGTLGESIVVSFGITYTTVENGVNAIDTQIFVDGREVFFQSFSVSRVKTTSSFTPIGATADGAGNPALVTTDQNALSVDISAPMLEDEFGAIIEDELYKGYNDKPHCLEIRRKKANGETERHAYITTISPTANGTPPQNIGLAVSFAEAAPSGLKFVKTSAVDVTPYTGWKRYDTTGMSLASQFVANTDTFVAFRSDGSKIFWPGKDAGSVSIHKGDIVFYGK